MPYRQPTVVGVGTAGTAASGNPTNPGLPPGWVAGDAHLMVVVSADNVSSSSTGWTVEHAVNNGAQMRLTILSRRAVAGDAAPTVTHAAGSSIRVEIVGIRGIASIGALVEAVASQVTLNSATVTAPTISTLTPGAAVLFVAGETLAADTSNAPTYSGYSGTDPTFVEIVGSDGAFEGGADEVSQAVAFGTKVAAGATGARTATITGGAAGQDNVGALVALTPDFYYDPKTESKRQKRALRLGARQPIDGWRTWDVLRFSFPKAAPAGGTLFTVTIGGTLTSAGALIKTVGKLTLGGTTSPTGAIARVLGKLGLGGTMTSSGALTKVIGKLNLAGTLTSAGALVKTIIKQLGGTLTSSGALTLLKVKIIQLAGTLTSSGALVKTNTRLLGGTMTSSGVIRRANAKQLGGTTSPTGAIVKSSTRSLGGTLTSSGLLATLKVKIIQIGGTLTSSGAVVKTTIKQLAGTLTSSGALRKATTKTLDGVLSPSGAIRRGITKLVGGLLGLIGDLLIGGGAHRGTVTGGDRPVGLLSAGTAPVGSIVAGATAVGSVDGGIRKVGTMDAGDAKKGTVEGGDR